MADDDGGGCSTGCGGGLTLGGLLAAFVSYHAGNSAGWMFVHLLFGWSYLLYLLLGFGGGWPESLTPGAGQ